MNRSLHHAAFAVGLAAIAWVGAGYFPGNLLALALVLLIGAFFLMGALELHHFQQATTSLARVVGAAHEPPAALGTWLAPLHPSLQHTVRLRVEGERVALPGPSLTPYLAGLLVLLGMLGTFLGMVVTLKGTGLALENATDVDAIRASLAAPVKGLGLAFGTSVAGVAASAMLGLMSALARRERQRTGLQLDARIATTLRGFSRAHQREESLRLLQAQAEVMPALVTQLQGLVVQMERQGLALHDRLIASQAEFQGEAQRAYTGLAESVDRTLRASLTDSARLASAAIEPAVQATMAGLTSEATTLRHTLTAAVQQQLDGVTARLDTTTTTLAERWQAALADQQRHSEAVTQGLHAGMDRFAATFEQRSTTLLDGVAARLDRSADQWSASWGEALAQQRQGNEVLSAHTREAWSATVAGFEQQAASLLKSVADAHVAWDAAAAAREQTRLAAFQDGLAGVTRTLQQQALQDGATVAERQQQICTTLEHTAQAIAAQAEAHARATIGEITRLVQAASEAPRAAAEVIGELRHALSDSLVRDNAALDERNRLMATLAGLLDAVNHASTEQRAAIDTLVNTTTDVLDRVGARFADTVAAESRTLQTVAAQVTGGAAEVASLGEGFGLAVQLFSRSSEQMIAQLERIESALGHTMARSDEQLAYYVAQAREIVDLTLGSQKQIFEDLQQLTRVPVEADPA
ncbi:DUF802 domain-containing protein [Rhizobacter sp. Root1221]|uniref:DUF802 domain-containing protein n=1 Tax=Rhizobacter sp. Root1221 TaxID=1736433 RepID=UPI0006F27B27|nr:DUF802 domain-containing protein [Rhizobacter sp. Root1221]KQV98388.1 hypothetical protein ASC87_22250 [Rhizobacter sp. Root1221]